VRHSLERSMRRFRKLIALIEPFVRPTHMITLTLPPDAWEELPEEERVARFRRAKAAFFHALRMRLRRRVGEGWGYLWWLEYQRRGAPHLHIHLDLGGRLPEEEWADWVRWVREEWARALGLEEAPAATRIEWLRTQGFNYAEKYASKEAQKQVPFSAAWGDAYGLAGKWREILRRERENLWKEASTYELDHASLEAFASALEAVYPSFSGGKLDRVAVVFLRGIRGVLEGERWAAGIILPPPSSLGGELHPLILATLEAAWMVLNPREKAPIAAPSGSPLSPEAPPPPPPPAGAAIGAPPLEGGLGGWPSGEIRSVHAMPGNTRLV